MLHSPAHLMYDFGPADYSPVSRMFADWCAKQGARTTIEDEPDDGYRYVIAEMCGPDGGVDRYITAAFDVFTGRFAHDGCVATECEFHSVTTLKELANGLRTGHSNARGHRR